MLAITAAAMPVLDTNSLPKTNLLPAPLERTLRVPLLCPASQSANLVPSTGDLLLPAPTPSHVPTPALALDLYLHRC